MAIELGQKQTGDGEGRAGGRILVVDDEPAIRRFLSTTLSAQGYVVERAIDGESALDLIRTFRPDLLILDLGLPGVDGFEVLRMLREWSRIPIIILSVREREDDKVAALDLGADDYLTKPFSTGELLARVRAALRRAQGSGEPVVATGELKVDLSRRIVTVGGQEVQLTPTEYGILRVLAVNLGRVITHRQILREVWGQTYGEDVHMLRVNMSNIRRKIEPDATRPRYIVTEPGVGYRMREIL